LPFKEKSFDLVILANILEHVDNPKKVVDEAKRVYRGRIYIPFPTKYSLSVLYHILSGSQANFKGGLDYKSAKKWFEPEFEVEKERAIFTDPFKKQFLESRDSFQKEVLALTF